jgi:serine/threonine protein kinase
MNFPIFDPKQKYFPEIVISDLGEGFAVSKTKTERQIYYGDVDFWAPEVKSLHQYSYKSDIYALGCLLRVMLEKKWSIDVANGGERGVLPMCYFRLVLHTLGTDPSTRIDATEFGRLCDRYYLKYIRLIGENDEAFEWTRDMVRIGEDFWDNIDSVNVAVDEAFRDFLSDSDEEGDSEDLAAQCQQLIEQQLTLKDQKQAEDFDEFGIIL